jgi:hypothetical protein
MRKLNLTGVHFCLMGHMTYSFETSIDFQRTTRRYIPEDRTFHNGRCENGISYITCIVDMHRGPMFLSCITFDQEPDCATKLAVNCFFFFSLSFSSDCQECAATRVSCLCNLTQHPLQSVWLLQFWYCMQTFSLRFPGFIYSVIWPNNTWLMARNILTFISSWELPKQINDETSVPLVGRGLPERTLKTKPFIARLPVLYSAWCQCYI